MFRLLIVEDEKMLRESLGILVDWESVGIQIAGMAANGKEALEMLRQQPVDIVLTDIRMPAMDGLELACELQSRYPAIKTVLYSAYSEFSFAQKGIEYGVSGYLLKSQDEEEIAAYFQELCRKMQKEQQIRLPDSGNLWSWREELFGRLCQGGSPCDDQMRKRCKISWEGQKLAVMVWDLDNAGMLREELGDTGYRQLVKFLSEQLLTRLEWQGKGYLMQAANPFGVIWTDFGEGWEERLENLQKDIHADLQSFESSFPLTVTVSVGSCVPGEQFLSDSWESAQAALVRKFYLGNGHVVHAGAPGYPCERISPVGEMQQALQNAAVYCQSQDCDSLLRLLGQLHTSWTSRRIQDRKTVETFAAKFLLLLAENTGSQGEGQHTFVSKSVEFLHAVSQSDTMDGIFDRLALACQELLRMPVSENGRPLPQHPPKRVVEKAILYLRENYSEDISLERVAAYVAVHPVHLSRLFRQETGQTFKELLTSLRMEAAKELLREPELRVYEIAEKVGYHKPRYFSELFKEMTGMTPLEYREKR